MGQPVVHFEVMGQDGERLRSYYAELFGWAIDADNPLGYGVVTREGLSFARPYTPGRSDPRLQE